MEAAGALGAGAPNYASRRGAKLAARDADRFAAAVSRLAENDARASVDALTRAVRAAADRAGGADELDGDG